VSFVGLAWIELVLLAMALCAWLRQRMSRRRTLGFLLALGLAVARLSMGAVAVRLARRDPDGQDDRTAIAVSDPAPVLEAGRRGPERFGPERFGSERRGPERRGPERREPGCRAERLGQELSDSDLHVLASSNRRPSAGGLLFGTRPL